MTVLPALRPPETTTEQDPPITWQLTELSLLDRPDRQLSGIGPLWVLVRTGAVVTTSGAARFQLGTGDALLLATAAPYEIAVETDTALAIGDLSPSVPILEPVLTREFAEHNHGIVQLITACPMQRDNTAPSWRSSYANLIGTAILLSRTDEDPLDHAEDDALAGLIGALLRRPGDPWTLDAMATYAHLSRSSLVQRFRRTLDASPAQVLRRVRMKQARSLLVDGSLSVAQIAFAIGYNSTAAFSRAFSHDHGVSPRCWRAH